MRDVLVIAAVVVVFGLVSDELRGRPVTPPMLFTLGGLVLGGGALGLLRVGVSNELLRVLAEATLVVVLFSDASRMRVGDVRRHHALALRLLLVGIPLAILLGTAVALPLFSALGVASAGLLAAVLAPTDAALGQAVVSQESVPIRIRQTLNVESGLNDGLSVPFITLLSSIAGHREASPLGFVSLFVRQVGIGVAVGAAVGLAGGWVLARAVAARWTTEPSQRLAALAFAALAYAAATIAGGNGFIATFTAGLLVTVFGSEVLGGVRVFAEAEGLLLGLVTFLVFGAAVVTDVLGDLSWRVALYALVSLAVVRPAAVALSLLRSGVRPLTVAFVGWFGPRGLATIVFALLVVDSAGIGDRALIFTVASWTVIASVFLHGLTAAPAAARYGRRMAKRRGPEHEDVPELPTRLHARAPAGGAGH